MTWKQVATLLKSSDMNVYWCRSKAFQGILRNLLSDLEFKLMVFYFKRKNVNGDFLDVLDSFFLDCSQVDYGIGPHVSIVGERNTIVVML